MGPKLDDPIRWWIYVLLASSEVGVGPGIDGESVSIKVCLVLEHDLVPRLVEQVPRQADEPLLILR